MYLPIKMEQTECSKTSAYKIQTPGNYPEENIQLLGDTVACSTSETVAICIIRNRYCGDTNRYCGDTNRYCGDTKRYYGDTNGYCGDTNGYCGDTKRYYGDTNRYYGDK
jgi:hypothetical protein